MKKTITLELFLYFHSHMSMTFHEPIYNTISFIINVTFEKTCLLFMSYVEYNDHGPEKTSRRQRHIDIGLCPIRNVYA